MLRTLLTVSLLSLSIPALAIYKCESAGATSYSETPCPGGQLMDAPSKASDAGAAQSSQQLAREKAQLGSLEKARHKREAQEEKEQQRASRAQAAKQKKCASLEQRKKWMQEDAAAASGKSAEKAKRKAQRMAEKYALACA